MTDLFEEVRELALLLGDAPLEGEIYSVDRALRAVEGRMRGALLPIVVQEATSLGYAFFENFSFPVFSSVLEAIECRFLYVPILYKLGMTGEAAELSEATFKYLFPHIHGAVEKQIERIVGREYRRTCEEISKEYRCENGLVSRSVWRTKSIHSVWKKVDDLEALTKMSPEEFSKEVNDFIGVRWEMRVDQEENRYDALIRGVSFAPMGNLKSFRNQQLSHVSGFDNEPVMKLCYVLKGIPVELQVLGGNLAGYLSTKGYAVYKAKIPFPPEKKSLSEDAWNRRLGMAIEYADQKEYLKYMYDELVGEEVDYTKFTPFVLEEMPLDEKNRALLFSSSPIPIWKLAELRFEKDPELLASSLVVPEEVSIFLQES